MQKLDKQKAQTVVFPVYLFRFCFFSVTSTIVRSMKIRWVINNLRKWNEVR